MFSDFIKEVRMCLTNNILPYWYEQMLDPWGGFFGRRDGTDCLEREAPRGAIMTARILWAMAASYRVLGVEKYRETAELAKREIIDKFYDPEYGGVYWSIDESRKPLDTKKQFYAIGFAIYGLSELARATGDTEARDMAMRLFRDIENYSHDHKNGGYIEALTRDWQPIEDMRLSEKDYNASKTMNTHLHIIEPYTNLLRCLHPGSEQYKEVAKATASLLRLFFDKIEKERGHLGLFFDDEWNRQDHIISYGHDIEASWLLLETAQVLGDEKLLERTKRETRRMAMAALEGRCVDGSMIYERHASGAYDNDKHWWVQAECVVGQLWLYRFHDMPEQLERAYQTWRYIVKYLIDFDWGEWHWKVNANGEIDHYSDKAGFWKCPYHNSRMCLEVIERLSEIAPVKAEPQAVAQEA
ncbi:MAG: AGE family epimerase/isomerase [Bacteroidales bacterium]|nr:AGE family epimerase/isomerase [Bacteroidales bacterium]